MARNEREIEISFVARTAQGLHAAFNRNIARVRQFAGAVSSASQPVAALEERTLGLKSALLGLGAGFSLAAVISTIASANKEVEELKSQLADTIGPSQSLADEFDYVREVADELCLTLADASAGYAALNKAAQGTSLQGEKTRKIFESLVKYGQGRGWSQGKTNSLMESLGAMLEQGAVDLQALKQELGQDLPAALAVAAEAMGMTTAELTIFLDQGKVAADQFLPHLAQALEKNMGEAADKASQTFAGASTRVGENLKSLKSRFGEIVTENGFFIEVLNLAADELKLQEKGIEENAHRWELWKKETTLSLLTFAEITVWVGDKAYRVFHILATGVEAVYGAVLTASAAVQKLLSIFTGGETSKYWADEARKTMREVEATARSIADRQKKILNGSELAQETVSFLEKARTKIEANPINPLAGADKEGKKTFDRLAALSKKAWDNFQKNSGEALQKSLEQWKKYNNEVADLNDKLWGRVRDISKDMREIRRGDMSESDKWKDEQNEVNENIAKWKELSRLAERYWRAGDAESANANWERANHFRSEAIAGTKALNREVAEGEEIILSEAEARVYAHNKLNAIRTADIELTRQRQLLLEKERDTVDAQHDGAITKLEEQNKQEKELLSTQLARAELAKQPAVTIEPIKIDGVWHAKEVIAQPIIEGVQQAEQAIKESKLGENLKENMVSGAEQAAAQSKEKLAENMTAGAAEAGAAAGKETEKALAEAGQKGGKDAGKEAGNAYVDAFAEAASQMEGRWNQMNASLKTSYESVAKAFSASWKLNFRLFMLDASTACKEVEKYLQELTKDRTINIKVKTTQAHSTGGLVAAFQQGGAVTGWPHFAAGTSMRDLIPGGWLSGFGGGDTQPALLEKGETVNNKWAVRAAGLKASLAFNSQNWATVMSELAARFPSAAEALQERIYNNVIRFSDGGAVGSTPSVRMAAAAPTPSEVVQLNLNIGGNTYPTIAQKDVARAVQQEIRRLQRLSS